MSTSAHCKQWLELPEEAISVDNVKNILGAIPDDAWVAAAVADKTVDKVDVQRALLALGLEKTVPALERSRKAVVYLEGPIDGDDDPADPDTQLKQSSLVRHFATHTTDELLCHLRAVLLERLDRLETYVEISRQLSKGKQNQSNEAEDGWDDLDPWEETRDADYGVGREGVGYDIILPVSLSSFLRRPLLHTALHFALNLHFEALATLLQRHAKSLAAHRLYILQAIPDHVHPSEFLTLLPAIDPSTESEAAAPHIPWRDSQDWTETEECTSAFSQQKVLAASTPLSSAHSISEVSQWYRDRIHQTDSTGLVDVALALVQHGASQGVPDLDELGEELGLLARLVYDAPRPVDDIQEDGWTLSRWSSLDPLSVLRAYLAYSTPESIADNIRRLAMPYLFVLESRAERAGTADPGIVHRVFYKYLLQTELHITAAIFSSSKPTLPIAERLIKNDEDMARLALACLYGSDNLTDWKIMSQMFECLPEWTEVNEEDGDEANTTLLSLGDFVTPSTSRPRCSPQELFLFFSPLPASAYVHLESGEILARWNVPAPLRWFLQSANNEEQQRSWATRMSRRAGSGGDEPESEEDWLELLDDMLKLVGGGEGALRVTRIFFSGLLSSGNFRVAKSVLRKSRTPYLSNPQVVEDQVLASSREFYDNASSGNSIKCLSVAGPSPTIQREREFIEATSRICSFNVVSRQGIPISPIEIRLVKDRLTLIARVLSSTEDAYKHSKVILDLMHKLGYRDDVAAEVRVQAMLAEAALQAEDFLVAGETAERMVDIVRKLSTASPTSGDAESEKEAKEVCWHSCFQLGRQTEFHDVDTKLRLLGHALELCPSEHLLDVLSVWRKLEGESLVTRREDMATREENAKRQRQAPPSATASFRTSLQDLQLGTSTGITGPDAAAAAALASRTFKTVAANFPFSVRGRHSEEGKDSWDGGSVGNENEGPGADVSGHAKQAFARGIGWLIGADEE
ncbi:secretory pathway protein Sec39-domain-containing protein [Gautieria morchelliformis]|nr:secretory pathway protein Sec39-domain-containing protein [Gautieria morchelliformis]